MGACATFRAQISHTNALMAEQRRRQKQDQERSEKGDDICYTNISNFSIKYSLGSSPRNTYISAECLIQNAPILIVYVFVCAGTRIIPYLPVEKYI